MKYTYFNDTKRNVYLHPATECRKIKCSMEVIKPLEAREFIISGGYDIWTKMWDNGDRGLTLLVWAQEQDYMGSNI